jgi:antirestriction protein ArdC
MKNGFKKINEMITQRMIDRINETGTLPWKKPWASVSMLPRNLISKKPYRGVNVFMLHMLGFASPYFLSFKQVTELGGKVRKGEKSCFVVFWRFVDAEEQDKPDAKSYCMLRYYRVFNAEQCEGLPTSKVPVIEVPKRKHTPLEIAEELVRSMPNPPSIKHGCRNASYSPSLDLVKMPDPETFHSGESYYAALFHELSHGTGHTNRLARKAIMEPNGFGTDSYSLEELVAELGSSFLCGHCEILPKVEANTAAYLKGWLKRLKAEPSMLITAGGQAQKVYDYVVGDAAEQELTEVEAEAEAA